MSAGERASVHLNTESNTNLNQYFSSFFESKFKHVSALYADVALKRSDGEFHHLNV